MIVKTAEGRLHAAKHPTTHEDVWLGAQEALAAIARSLGTDLVGLLGRTTAFIWGTTAATNAILEEKTARTALFVTQGFPDTLVWREGGKQEPFDFREDYPRPYVPRRLTFEIPERINADGEIVLPIDLDSVRDIIGRIDRLGVQAVAICLLWSIVNPIHEIAVARELKSLLPSVAYSMSHVVNPIIREYRRASSTAIDASLKPLMESHFLAMEVGLRASGFEGELLTLTCLGGAMHVPEIVARPILSVNSGPSTAPVAATAEAAEAVKARSLIVCDMGGTSFDVSLVEDGEIRHSRDSWIGRPFVGHLIGLDAVTLKTIGAGGGSIACVDSGGLLRVGPESAGSFPGPACYRRGGANATFTDAALCLGYIASDRFLGGKMSLDFEVAESVIAQDVAQPLALTVLDAAHAIVAVTAENMVNAIADITINAGVDPRECAIVAGGGAAGLTICVIAAELGCSSVLVPPAAATMSAAGAQAADIVSRFGISHFARAEAFPYAGVNSVLADLDRQMDVFLAGLAASEPIATLKTFSAEARYANQIWELEVTLESPRIEPCDLPQIVEEFHRLHERHFGASDREQLPEFVRWNGRAAAILAKPETTAVAGFRAEPREPREAAAFFPGKGLQPILRYEGQSVGVAQEIRGPALIDEPLTTIVVPPDWSAVSTIRGGYQLNRIAE